MEVMEGKKNVIGQVVVDCSQGIWPNGEWIPTEPGVDSGWMDLQAAGKKSKFEGSRGQVGITYMYAGESAHPPRLSCRSRLRHAERACASSQRPTTWPRTARSERQASRRAMWP